MASSSTMYIKFLSFNILFPKICRYGSVINFLKFFAQLSLKICLTYRFFIFWEGSCPPPCPPPCPLPCPPPPPPPLPPPRTPMALVLLDLSKAFANCNQLVSLDLQWIGSKVICQIEVNTYVLDRRHRKH